MSQADSARALGKPPAGVESSATGGDIESSLIPPATPPTSFMWIRLYDVCPDGTRHTDPQLQHIEGSYL